MNNFKGEFNWDDISVGDFNLDHSQNYFAVANKENANLINILKTPIGRPKPTDNGNGDACTAERIRIPLVWDSPKGDKEEKIEIKAEPESEQQQSEEKEEVIYKATNIKLEWSIANREGHGTNDALAACAGPAPRAYAFKDVYQHNREEAQRKREEEERRARQFHSRPVPNFRAYHKRLDEAVVVHKITAPVTPNVVKHGLADRLRRKQREEMQLGKQAEQDEAKAKKEQIQTNKSSQPFQLRSEQRARERREFDATVKTLNERKKRQQEEERIKRELEEKKELRKMTEFRARPNPFK